MPPGAPAGGRWIMFQYFGKKTWTFQLAVMAVHFGLFVLCIAIGNPVLVVFAFLGGVFIDILPSMCLADTRHVYESTNMVHGRCCCNEIPFGEQYDEHGVVLPPDCCGNGRWGPG